MLIVVFLTMIVTVVEASSTHISSFHYGIMALDKLFTYLAKLWNSIIYNIFNHKLFISCKTPMYSQGCWNTAKCEKENNDSLYILFKNRKFWWESATHAKICIKISHPFSDWAFLFNPKYHMKTYPDSSKIQYPHYICGNTMIVENFCKIHYTHFNQSILLPITSLPCSKTGSWSINWSVPFFHWALKCTALSGIQRVIYLRLCVYYVALGKLEGNWWKLKANLK